MYYSGITYFIKYYTLRRCWCHIFNRYGSEYSESITHCLAASTSVVFDVVVVGNNKDSGLSHKKYM